MTGNEHKEKTKVLARWELSHRSWLGYAIAIIGSVAAVVLRWLLLDIASDLPLYITFYPAIFAAAVVGGTGPGLLATFLCAFFSVWFFIEPKWTLALGTPSQMIGLGIFIGFNVALSFLGGTLRKRSDALRESEARVRLAHQVTNIGSFEIDIETGINTWSPELESMYGLQPGQFAGTEAAWEALVHPDDRVQAVAAVNRAMRTFQPDEGEWRVIWPDGSIRCLVGRFQAFPNKAGKPVRLVGINVDITERKKTEEDLRQREEWFRTMADSIPQLAWTAGADGRGFWYNRRCYEYTGTKPGNMNELALEHVVAPESLPRIQKQWQHSIATGEPYYDWEFPIRDRDGQYRLFLTRVMPLNDKDGRVARWFGTATDIQELRDRESVLRRQARLIDLSPTATLVRDLDGIISFWSEGATRLYGWTKEEAIGRRTRDLLRTEFSEPFEGIVEKLRQGKEWVGELRRFTRDGRQVIVESSWLAELDSHGQVKELLESNTDITERKRLQEHLEDEVEERTREVRETLAELEHMSYSMIHDMRAPLRAMQSFAHILQEEITECQHPPALDYLQRIERASVRLDHLITDALNYNRLVRQEATVSPVNVGELLREMIDTYPNLHPYETNISLEFDAIWVLGNQSLLTQCFGNLLDNAVKFVAPGVQPTIRIWAEELESPEPSHDESSATIRVWIEDNGIGIPMQAQEKIFRMFQRMHNETEYPGTGIGLAMVKKAVERMNGHIGLQSAPGEGSKFWIELPKAVEVEEFEHASVATR